MDTISKDKGRIWDSLQFKFGRSYILIIAGVGLDTLRQAKAQTEQFQYAGFLFEGTDHKEGK